MTEAKAVRCLHCGKLSVPAESIYPKGKFCPNCGYGEEPSETADPAGVEGVIQGLSLLGAPGIILGGLLAVALVPVWIWKGVRGRGRG